MSLLSLERGRLRLLSSDSAISYGPRVSRKSGAIHSAHGLYSDAGVELNELRQRKRHRPPLRGSSSTVATGLMLACLPRPAQCTDRLRPRPDQYQLNAKDAMAKFLPAVRRLRRQDLDALSEGLVWQDGEGRIIDANAAAAPILGLSLDELLGRSPHDPRWYAVHEDGTPWPGHEHPGMVAIRTGMPQRDKLMGVMAPTAGRRWIRIDATPQFKTGVAAPVGVMASFVDVTAEVDERHRLQQALAALRGPQTGLHRTRRRAGMAPAAPLGEAWAHLDRVQAVARIGSFAMDGDPDHFTYTRETARLFELDEHGHASFAQWFDRVHPEDQAAVRAAWEAALHGAAYDITYRVVTREQVRWIRARAEVQLDAQGHLLTAVGTVQDVSDLKSITQELERSRQRLQLALEASALGTWDFDLRTGCVERDTRFLAMLGYAPGELGTDYASFIRLIHPDDVAPTEGAAAAHFRGETVVYEIEHRLRHKDGHYVWVLSVGKVVERDAEARPLRILGTNRDISQHKRVAEGSISLLRRIEQLISDLSPRRTPASSLADTADTLNRLTPREREVAGLIASGLTSGQIGERLQLTAATVITHRRNLMAKLKLHSTAEVTRFAVAHGLVAGN